MNQQKIIDVHTHVYPSDIRNKAVTAVGDYYTLKMHAEGSPEDLVARGSRVGIVKYVLHPVATRPEQVSSGNHFTSGLQQQNSAFVGFGTIHPETPNPRATVDDIIRLGLHGVKLHPEFQGFYIDDPHMFPIYEAIEGRLPLLIHMGDENVTSSSPGRLVNIIKQFPSLTIIAPHLGGYAMWDEVIEKLVGQNIYLDTSSSLSFLDRQKAVDIIRAHGTDKVMFGTDYPMWLPGNELELFYRLGLTEQENAQILYENAARLLNLDTQA